MNYDLKDPAQRLNYWNEEAAKLQGATLTTCQYVKDTFGPVLLMVFRLPDGTLHHAWVMRDDEGNGPGSLHFNKKDIGGGCLPRL